MYTIYIYFSERDFEKDQIDIACDYVYGYINNYFLFKCLQVVKP